MIEVLSGIAVLALLITTGMGVHVLRGPKHVVPEKLDEVEWRQQWD